MVGKRVQFDDETWSIIELVRRERHCSFQQLADEAFADLLNKLSHPVGVEVQLRASLAGEQRGRRHKTTKPSTD